MNDTATGKFNGVVLTGLFTAVDGTDLSSCLTDVTLETDDGSIGFTEQDNVLMSNGDLDDVDFSGGTETVTDGPTCSVEGSISDGTFVRIGTVAVAELTVTMTVWKCLIGAGSSARHPCAVGDLHATATVSATAVVSAVPGAGDPPGDPASAQVEGVVVAA